MTIVEGERGIRGEVDGRVRGDAAGVATTRLPPTIDTLVIGAGQAGLAMGNELARRDGSFLIVDGATEVGAAWRSRWDSLRLFTPRRFSSLPGLPLPGDPEGLPSKDEVADYLTTYQDRLELPVRLRTPVTRLSRAEEPEHLGGYRADTPAGTVIARQVVVATGPFQRGRVPGVARGLDPSIDQVHAVDYRNPSPLPEGPVLVVGGGNSGVQIASELACNHEVTLAVGARHPWLPERIAGRSIFVWLEAAGVMSVGTDTAVGRRLRRAGQREPLVGATPRRVQRRSGVRLTERIVDLRDGRPVTSGGERLRPRSIIWATGYAPDYSWIDLPVLGADGSIRQRAGSSDLPGLYTLGMPWQRSRGSALLGWVGRDASELAETIEPGAATASTARRSSRRIRRRERSRPA